MKNSQQITAEILALYAGPPGQESYGEGVTQLDHALQCAKFASDVTDDSETIIAALLHDIGHLCAPDADQMGEVGTEDHEGIGAAYLFELGFSQKVADLVGAHVSAKRYLVATNAEYAARLSPASAETLRYQGGPMNAEEVAAFENDPLLQDKLQMRSWDEMGKEVDFDVPPLESYQAMMIQILQGL